MPESRRQWFPMARSHQGTLRAQQRQPPGACMLEPIKGAVAVVVLRKGIKESGDQIT